MDTAMLDKLVASNCMNDGIAKRSLIVGKYRAECISSLLSNNFSRINRAINIATSEFRMPYDIVYDRCESIRPFSASVADIFKSSMRINADIVTFNEINWIAAQLPCLGSASEFRKIIVAIDLIISLVEVSENADYMLPFPKICEVRGNHIYMEKFLIDKKIVYRIVYPTWADHRTPDLAALDELCSLIENIQCKNAVVHCLMGVGRTGTFLLYYMLTKYRERTIEQLTECFLYLRCCRYSMVFTKEQMAFLVNYVQHTLK